MGKLNFNPDDFVFEQLPSPDEKKTILEYDAKNRLILLRTKDDGGNYIYNSVVISEKINENILKNISDEWSNNNDRIILFAIYENGDYMLEKEKLKYDFSTKSTRWIQYTTDHLSLDQAKELYNVLNAAITIDTEMKNYNTAKEYLELSKKTYYLTEFGKKNTDIIEKLLRGTDWRVLPDTPEFFENEKEMWVMWRNKIRELDKDPSDFENGLDYVIWLEELKWPMRPDQYYAKYSQPTPGSPQELIKIESFEAKYLETKDQFFSTPEFLDLKSSSPLMGEVDKLSTLVDTYKEQGFEINPATSKLVEKYNLIKDIEEFKTIKMKELE
jgi:hypothetical protein